MHEEFKAKTNEFILMNHASLFSGIGGFDLAAEWMGWTNVFHCEIEWFPRQVLKYHFPKSKSYADIKQTDFTIWRGHIDIVTGGFPC
jgi:DNA (cytosine-5)-methyltransferase 1